MGCPDGVLLLDKPAGFSSTQALARSKRLLDSRKAGHTGTLDPFATGLLPLVFGQATKFSRFLLDSTKAYEATLRLGSISTTGDTEGVVSRSGVFDGNDSAIDEILRRFLGTREQIPPMHSAVHVDGRRLYELAREGKEVERAARRIHVHELRRLRREGDDLAVHVACSKGTYIRTLAAEIGAALGCGAYLVALRRTAVGPFAVDSAVGLDDLERLGIASARQRLLPVEVLVAGLPRRDCDPEDVLRMVRGQVIAAGPGTALGEEFAVFGPGGAFIGVARCDSPATLSPTRLMATGEATKLPDFA